MPPIVNNTWSATQPNTMTEKSCRERESHRYTHTHTHNHTHPHIHTQSHPPHAHPHTYTHTHTHIHTYTRTQWHTHPHIHTHTHTPSPRTHPHIHTHTHTPSPRTPPHIHTHTHTYTHTHVHSDTHTKRGQTIATIALYYWGRGAWHVQVMGLSRSISIQQTRIFTIGWLYLYTHTHTLHSYTHYSIHSTTVVNSQSRVDVYRWVEKKLSLWVAAVVWHQSSV